MSCQYIRQQLISMHSLEELERPLSELLHGLEIRVPANYQTKIWKNCLESLNRPQMRHRRHKGFQWRHGRRLHPHLSRIMMLHISRLQLRRIQVRGFQHRANRLQSPIRTQIQAMRIPILQLKVGHHRIEPAVEEVENEILA